MSAPLSHEELNKRRKEISDAKHKEFTLANDNVPGIRRQQIMLRYLEESREALTYALIKGPLDKIAFYKDQIACLEYLTGQVDILDVESLIDVNPAPIAATLKDFDLYPSSRSELAQRVYETVYYDPGSRDTFRHVKHEWLPIVDAFLEALPEIMKKDAELKASTFEKEDSE